MSTLLVVALTLGAAPAVPPTLADLQGPLGTVSRILTPVPQGGTAAGERRTTVQPPGCKVPQSVDLGRFLQGTLFALNQVQTWLDGQAGLEASLFSQKGTLGEVARLSAGAQATEQRMCGAGLKDGYRLDLVRAPALKCKATPERSLGDHWWEHGGRLAAVVHIAPPDRKADPCGVRLSAVLFDQKGKARFRYHADLQGAPVAALLGDFCRTLDFQAQESGAYKGTLTTCKR